jgi:hypothetical protein
MCGCKGDDLKESYNTFVSSVWSDSELEQIDFIIIIPHQGCSGCITYAEDFYCRYKSNKKIKFIFTHIVSMKNLRNRLKLDMDNAFIDKNNQLLVIGEADKKIYPCILQLGNGKITDIYYQSPYEDGFSIVEKYFNSVL